ncbi:MAG: PQQ-binding-like beta-propeller repeat protein [Lentisphaerae bacterium]|mgnify:CR=1 FL=1|jgi:hypothetical protein|nr:PQQ-binding-like beta-propeller repeat protein [Lentisphaerota bacterium]MBT5611515.1 PQQ-binding-like beta-propeller repeat protein [Lentisphaerota bacterium]MBT7054751.1 PQQ-binding-like beta-propeller repeat protein [Lentisphaerota bacterium]MBT7844275.1 PQQ-binding-like beta-propeller repeat protein [Lentisphaerota bacterium]
MRLLAAVLSTVTIFASCLYGDALLHGCEDLGTVSLTSKPVRQDTVTMHVDAPYVTQGRACLHMYLESSAAATGNTYLSWSLTIPPTDLTTNALLFDAATGLPETTQALYVRGYDDKGSVVLSWYSWASPLETGMKTFRLVAGATGDGLRWEPLFVQPGDMTRVVKLQFYIGTHGKGVPFGAYLDNVRSTPTGTTYQSAGSTEEAGSSGQFSVLEPGRTNPPPSREDGDIIAEPTPVFLAEDLTGVRVKAERNCEDARLETNTDPGYVSEGRGSLFLAGRSRTPRTGNTYVSAVIDVPPVDLSNQALLLDAWTSEPKHTGALYVRGYDPDDRCVVSWSSWSSPLRETRTRFELFPALSTGTLAWRPKEIASEDRSNVVRLRVWTGTAKGGVSFNMYLDNVRAAHSKRQPFMNIATPKERYPNTMLVGGGKARAMIVTPAGPPWEPLAAEIAAAVAEATGVDLPVVLADQTSDEAIAERNAIVLGTIADNPRLLYPYSHSLVFADGIFPGTGGFELRTVHDPWGTGKNLICIGASDAAGARLGVDAFRASISPTEELIIPRMLKVKLTGPALASYGKTFASAPDKKWEQSQKDSCEKHLRTAGTRGLFSRAQSIGRIYAITRREEYARMFVWMIQRTYRNYLSDPKTYGGPWGMDSDFHIFGVIPGWDAVEESAMVTDEERLEVTRILFRWVSEIGPSKAAKASSKRVRFNHQTFPALGCLHAGQYFSRYYNCLEGERWIEVADGTFQYQLNATKPHCDCNTYQWHTLHHLIRYCLARPDLSYFENGGVRNNADYAILTMNNLGYQVPYGDIGGWGPISGELHMLRAAEWFQRDGRFQWALNKKATVRPRPAYSDFTVSSADDAPAPADLLGMRLWPLDKLWYDSFGGKNTVDLDHAFDKIAFRNGFEPADQYLLLDGLSVGGHCHMDGNSVLQWTENGRVWLADVDYIKSLPKYHNGVLILKDGQSAKIPGFCELENLAELPTAGISRSVVRNYAGVDWHRSVVWLKGQAFICIDQLRATEPGEYSFRAVWQTIGDVSLDGAVMSIEQKGQHAAVAMTSDTHCLINNDSATGKNWRTYPHATEAVARSFQGIVDRSLSVGDHANLFTVLYASGAQPPSVAATRLTDNVASVNGTGAPVIVAVADQQGRIDLPGVFEGKAEIVVMTPEKLYVVGVAEARLLGAAQVSEHPVDLEADLANGSVELRTPSATSVGAQPKTARAELEKPLSGDQAHKLMQLITDAAQPDAVDRGETRALPEAVKLWSYVEQPSGYLLTNNPGTPERVDVVKEITCSPLPLEANVFSGTPGANILGSAIDGHEQGTGDAVMWDDDQEVTIALRLKETCELTALKLKAWFATASSKNKQFQLGRIRLLASTDGFADDTRTVIDLQDSEAHGNWGAPGHQPQPYEFVDLQAQARDVRLVLTPRPGTAVYLAEMQLWGDGDGLEELRAANHGGAAAYTFTSVHCADLNGDGVTETIAGSTNGQLYCFGADGSHLWRVDCNARINTVSTVDFDGDGRRAVIAGTMASQVVAVAASGEELWRFDVPYYKRQPYVRTVFPADLGGKGKQSVIAGADNWRYHAIDANGKLLWHQESVHASTAGCAVDLTGDGKQEVVCGTEYYWWPCAKPDDGSKLWGYRTAGGPCANAVGAGDIDGDGANEVIFGGADTLLQAVGPDGKRRWTFNTGDEVTSVTCIDVNGDGNAETIATSLSFNVYCVDGSGTLLWRTGLPNQIRAATVFTGSDGVMIGVGCDDGWVYVLNAATGQQLTRFGTRGKLIALSAGKLLSGKTGTQMIVASSQDGHIYAVKIPQ